jgi:RHS repeat-associated protein
MIRYVDVKVVNAQFRSGPTVLYTYGVTLPHAGRTLSNGNLYRYDANGNMTQRVGITATTSTYTQTWDAENRLTVVTNTVTNQVTQFVYDGDGSRVLQVLPDGSQTAYAGALEVSITGTQRITKTYYYAGPQLVAMRVYTSPTTSLPYYLHSDHLGSASLTTSYTGTLLARQRYDAWGNVRYVSGSMPTDIAFTGQRSNFDVGLYYFKARYYDSAVGRFLSADTIVPDPANPQSLNRYTYASNSPLNRVDPTGHCDSKADRKSDPCWLRLYEIQSTWGISILNAEYWEYDYLGYLSEVLSGVADMIGGSANLKEVFARAASSYGNSQFTIIGIGKGVPNCLLGCALGGWIKIPAAYFFSGEVERDGASYGPGDFYKDAVNYGKKVIGHELGHIVQNVVGNQSYLKLGGWYMDSNGNWRANRAGQQYDPPANPSENLSELIGIHVAGNGWGQVDPNQSKLTALDVTYTDNLGYLVSLALHVSPSYAHYMMSTTLWPK